VARAVAVLALIQCKQRFAGTSLLE